MLLNLGLLGSAMIVTMALIWIFGNIFVVRPLDQLVGATERFGAGEMNARTGLPHTSDELGQLAKSFDHMATLLEKRNTERKNAEESLYKTNAELQQHREHLEHEVARRTAELSESEERYRRIVETAQEGIWVLDADGRTTYANRRMTEMLGCVEDELLDRSVFDFVQKDDRKEKARHLERRSQGAREEYEFRFQRKDGSDLWVRISANPLWDERGAFIGSMGLVTDITDRVAAQRQLGLQAAALEAAANSIVITDRCGTILWANQAFTQLTGYTADEARGKNPRFLNSGKQDVSFYRRLWKTITSGDVWHGEITNRRKDGSLYKEEMTITPVRADSGEITHFVAIKQDITKRKASEDSVIARRGKVPHYFRKCSHRDFPDARPTDAFISANPALARMHGYDSPEQLMAEVSDVGRQLFVNPGQLKELTRVLEENDVVNDVEVEVYCKDGSKKWFLANVRCRARHRRQDRAS